MKNFEYQIEVRWSDCDPNLHVRHSVYYDYGASMRMKLISGIGYDTHKLAQHGIGPILFKEECSFIKEIRPDETITINVLRGPVTEGGDKWTLHHEIFNEKGKKAAHITVEGAWLDLRKRKLTAPPQDIAEGFATLPEGERYSYQKKG